MIKELIKNRRASAETVLQTQPRFLSTGEMVANAKNDIAEPLARWHISQADIEDFIDKKVTGVKLNGVDVLSIDITHQGLLDPITVAYLNAARTKVIMPEYFYPELARNAGIFSSLMKGSTDPRVRFAQNMIPTLQRSEKPIAVTDIANKPAYEITHLLSRYLPLIGVPVAAAASNLAGTTGIFGDLGSLGNAGFFVDSAIALLMGSNSLQEMDRKGIFNPDRVPRFDRLIPDWEQARRLIAAKGIEQLTTEYRPTGRSGEEAPQIVVLTPQAHGKRTANILVNPRPFLDKAQAAAYRLLGPRMDFAVRTYQWKDSLQKLAEGGYRFGQPDAQPTEIFPNSGGGSAGWMRISNRKIKI